MVTSAVKKMTKPQLRKHFLEKRTDSNAADDERIAAQLGEIFSNKQTGWLHSFVGNQARNEIDTKRIRQILQTEFPEIQWAAPRMILGTRKLDNYLWNDETQLITNRFGIEEPSPETSQPVEIEVIDAVLVPLLAFDRQGQRVGYGGGYYDRFLAQCRPNALKIGLSYFMAVEEIEDANEWDVKLDVCVTPGRIYRWSH